MTEKGKAALVERCKTITAWRERYGNDANVMLPAVEAEQLARIALAALTTPPAPAIPDGWRLVPVVPRMEQLISGRKSINGTGKMSHLMHQRLSDIYRAMLATAPEPGGDAS